ncbi:hypothetical protein [Waltera sp.]|uniref:hypothetical protein n=1 Tax=Waltera sp. TaxID=2815806 RepID=UPI003076D18C
MSKRISALLLAVVLVAGSVLNGNTLKVKAASATVAMSPELAAEFYLFLYQLTETAMHVGGANNRLDSKEAMETLRDGVIGYYSVSGEKNVDFEIKTTDGRTFKSYSSPEYRGGLVEYTTAEGQTYKLSRDKFTTLLLNGTITLDPDIYNDTDEEPTVNDDDEYVKNMKAMFDAKWEELREIGFKDDSGDPTPSPSPDPEKKAFKNIALVTVGVSLVALAGAFVKDLYNGKVEGVNISDYYTVPYNNYNLPVFDYSYLSSSSTIFSIDGSTASYVVNPDPFVLPEHCYYACVYQFSGSDYDSFSIMYVHAVGDTFYYDSGNLPCIGTKYSDGSSFSANVGSLNVRNNVRLSTNIPFFDSHDSMKKFFNTYMNKGLTGIDVSGLLNGEVYDFPELTKSVPTVMQPLTGYEFAPGRLRNVNQALADAATKVQPETGTDTAAATKTYTDTMTDTMTKVAPKTEVNPLPSTTPGTETGEGFEGESYKRDLKLLFPFCIPFDFIHLIQALKAEPETPKFEIPVKLDFVDVDTSIVIDLAWMDPIMKIWRLGELGLFIVMLMKSTSKMIRW